MELLQWILLLFLLIGVPLLYKWSPTFSFFSKMAFFFISVLVVTFIATPFLIPNLRRKVENIKLLRSFFQPLFYFFGINIVRQGSENLNVKEPYVIICNHQSFLDLFVGLNVIPDRSVPTAKRQLLRHWGLIGWVCWATGFIFIDRTNKQKNLDTFAQAVETMWREDLRIWLFPEGTRNQGNTMLPFKKGAFHLAIQAQVPIIPFVISSQQNFYSYKDRKFTAGKCIVQVLPKVETKGLSPQDIPSFAESIRKRMQETFYEISGQACGKKDH